MKTNRILALAQVSVIALAVVIASKVSTSSVAGDIGSGKGGATLLAPIPAQADKSGSASISHAGMGCGMCLDTKTSRNDISARGAKQQTSMVSTHGCNGCSTKTTVAGHGKAKTTSLSHRCSMAGDQNLTCCLIGKSAGKCLR